MSAMTAPSPDLRRRRRSITPRATDAASIRRSICPPSPASCKPTISYLESTGAIPKKHGVQRELDSLLRLNLQPDLNRRQDRTLRAGCQENHRPEDDRRPQQAGRRYEAEEGEAAPR